MNFDALPLPICRRKRESLTNQKVGERTTEVEEHRQNEAGRASKS